MNAATNKVNTHLQQEIAALRGFHPLTMSGEPIKTYAFGIYCPVDWSDFMPHDKNRDYNFTIYAEGDKLELHIDCYTATHGHFSSPDEFDGDAWADGHLVFEASLNRFNFKLLKRIARAWLFGFSIELPSGEIIQGCKKRDEHFQGTLSIVMSNSSLQQA